MSLLLKKVLLFLVIFIFVFEIISRILIDPLYYHSINTYNEDKYKLFESLIKDEDTKHVDYLFIGSSRIPATINPQLLKKLVHGKTVINAGRGYMTPGIHYQALKYKLKRYPDYLKKAVVFIEYAGCSVYATDFEEDQLKVYEPVVDSDEPMPHLLLPYLDFNSYLEFLKYSKNKINVKLKMTLLYFFASCRSCQFMTEYFNGLIREPMLLFEQKDLVKEGGIRIDKTTLIKSKASIVAKIEKEEIEDEPILTIEQINKSSFAMLQKIICDNGGTLMVYEMPLHSLQKDVYSSEKAKKNKVVFESWLKSKNIQVIRNDEFKYQDSDFPDTWHLARNRRDEFTEMIYKNINKKIGYNQIKK